MLSDLLIAQNAKLNLIKDIAHQVGLNETQIELYGNYKAKILLETLSVSKKTQGKLILVTAMSPTPAGEGKTTTTVGLGDALKRIGKKTLICLREPSLGPVFGMKGGAAGGGYAQVVPMEDINLHFTGDFNAIQLANNLLAALIDNHIHHGNALDFDVRRITWKRVLDMNDRALRQITVGLGGPANGYPREDGFDIVVASEVMAIFCLATSLADLKNRLANIVVGYTRSQKPITCAQLQAQGAMTVLLKAAFNPNLVQTLEHTPAFIHGGPFANIAHGCSSLVATQTALSLADYVVTEAGFGADLGAEKFVDIKCRKGNLKPAAAVVVATIRALKFHGGVNVEDLSQENVEAVAKGLSNLERHVHNVRAHYGLPCVVALNHFVSDTAKEIDAVRKALHAQEVNLVESRHWARGGEGAEELAHKVVQIAEGSQGAQTYVYELSSSLWEKTKSIATKIYGASDISANSKVRQQIQFFQDNGYGHLPICIAKTQYSFSTDPSRKGAPSDHKLDIREVRLSAGAEFIVMVCGDVMTMPGLPKLPAALKIDTDESGQILGLF
jgi:formate--tetrahydrofolate ligase